MAGEDDATVTLYRPVGQAELDLIRASGFREFPPRLAHQPIFYPVLNEEYATQIARDWNTQDAASGFVGYVTRFRVQAVHLARYEKQTVGRGQLHEEYWVPAEELEQLNANIVGTIEVVSEFRGRSATPVVPTVEPRKVGSLLATERDTGYELYVGARAGEGWVALFVSIARHGDIDTVCRPAEAVRLAAALRIHARAVERNEAAAADRVELTTSNAHGTAEIWSEGSVVRLSLSWSDEGTDPDWPDDLEVAIDSSTADQLAGLLDEAARNEGRG